MELELDVIVVGAGHAGTEAAVAAARLGARVGLITSALETIGQMSCNPAIGGVAKGTVAREVDALGGIMARATDLATLQFRMLNRGKGPAVWAPRAQCDRGMYRRAVRTLIEQHPRLHTIQGTVARLLMDDGGRHVRGIETLEGRRFGARGGRDHRRDLSARPAAHWHRHAHRRRTRGRSARAPPRRAARRARTRVRSIQDGHAAAHRRPLGRFCAAGAPGQRDRAVRLLVVALLACAARAAAATTRHPAQLPCWITFLGAEAKQIIADNIGKSAMYGGAIGSRGPRYCPSVEDKIVRFPDVERHQLFLEPEGHDTTELYVNGLSTSLACRGAARAAAFDSGARAGAHDARRIRDRVRLLPAHAARRHAAGQSAWRIVFRGADQRDHRLRGGGGAGCRCRNERCAGCPERTAGDLRARELIYRRARGRSRDARCR